MANQEERRMAYENKFAMAYYDNMVGYWEDLQVELGSAFKMIVQGVVLTRTELNSETLPSKVSFLYNYIYNQEGKTLDKFSENESNSVYSERRG